MTGEEHRELAALWNAAPPPAEEDRVARLARRTPALARLTQLGEAATMIMMVLAIIGAIIWRLGTETVVTGSLVAVLLGWSVWKRHRLARLARVTDCSDRFSFMCATVRAKEVQLDRSAVALALMLPLTLLALLFGYALQAQVGADILAFLPAALTAPRALLPLGLLAAAVLLMTVSHLRLLKELTRLRALRDDYLAELSRDREP